MAKKPLPDGTKEKMFQLALYIENNVDQTLSLLLLGQQVGLSTYYVQRCFKAVFGLSPKQYQNAARLKHLKIALQEGDDIAGAIFDAGFGSTSRVYEQVDQRLGMTPSNYRAGGKGEQITYAIKPTSLGYLLMAATDRGICCVHFGDRAKDLVETLANEFPAAQLLPSPCEQAPELDHWIEVLEHHFNHGDLKHDLPLHLNGTAFQVRVWKFLMSVARGETVSYGEVAQGIGSPSAVRAVANACAANNIAVLIPCHRVLRGDGSLGGYRWGKARKRALLHSEK